MGGCSTFPQGLNRLLKEADSSAGVHQNIPRRLKPVPILWRLWHD
jgi:hypothetical protein